jgi:hypothetical protein
MRRRAIGRVSRPKHGEVILYGLPPVASLEIKLRLVAVQGNRLVEGQRHPPSTGYRP